MTPQIERLRPHQIEAALARRSLVWLPLGTIEWHCHHLPVGLDALTAHGLCLRAAERAGGLVWPPLYFGTGGDHALFPWTVMMPGAEEIEALLLHTLRRLAALGVGQAILFSGHFADEQLAMIDRIAADRAAGGSSLRVTALSVNRIRVPGLPPDHAGLFETTLLAGLAPDLVDPSRLGEEADGADRFDPASPLWGIVGTDPRGRSPVGPQEMVERIVAALAEAAR